jgi:hypothetical protein
VSDPNERIDFIAQEWFYDDSSKPWESVKTRKVCENVLERWGVKYIDECMIILILPLIIGKINKNRWYPEILELID